MVEELAVGGDAVPVLGAEMDGKEGVEVEGATGAQADVREGHSAGNGEVFIEGSVTPLTLEDQGERANIQNGIGGRQLSRSEEHTSELQSPC